MKLQELSQIDGVSILDRGLSLTFLKYYYMANL
jgi:hypothetical protein